MENKDIFELIKRDILFQILNEGIIENDYVLTDSQMLTLYFLYKSLDHPSLFRLQSLFISGSTTISILASAFCGHWHLSVHNV